MNETSLALNPKRLVRLAILPSFWQARLLQHALELEGILCQVVGDRLLVRGNLTGRRLPELLVPACDLDQALAVLHQSGPPGSEVAADG